MSAYHDTFCMTGHYELYFILIGFIYNTGILVPCLNEGCCSSLVEVAAVFVVL